MPVEPSPPRGLVSILIPVLNQWELLEKALRSIRLHTRRAFEIVIVDNGSGPETREFLGRQGVRLIVNPVNRGFAAAVNQLVAAAAGETLVLMNSDIQVTSGWLEELELGLGLPQCGMVGPCTNYASGLQQIPVDYAAAGGPDGVAAELRAWRGGSFRRTERLVGFCVAFTRETADLVGAWDERFGIGNFEDDDYCLRVRLLGLECMVAEGAFVHHEGSATFRAENIDYRRLIETNRALFLEKWRNPELALLPSLLRKLAAQGRPEVGLAA